jgi:PleD family two-component response regulator
VKNDAYKCIDDITYNELLFYSIMENFSIKRWYQSRKNYIIIQEGNIMDNSPAITDSLTGLYNYRYFCETIDWELITFYGARK